MKNDELLHRWVNDELTEAEQQTFQQRPEYESLNRLRKQLDQMHAPAFKEEQMLQAILSSKKSRSKVLPFVSRRILLSVAAAVALLVVAWVFLLQPPTMTQLATNIGERLNEQLPDESLVVLNPESTLSYVMDDWLANRQLQLEGEAYFDVAKGSTFTVQTSAGKVEVLGTKFNVWSRDGQLEVSCYSGRVAVAFAAIAFDTVLTAGQAIRLDNQGTPIGWSVSEEMAQNHLLSSSVTNLQQAPLSRFIAELERQYGLVIKTNNVDTTTVLSASFPHDNLEQALEVVLRPLRVRYQIVSPEQVNLFREVNANE